MNGLNSSHLVFNIIGQMVKLLRIFQNEKTFCNDITFIQFCVLDTVYKGDKITLSCIGHELEIDKSTASRLLDPLVEKGFIVRVKSDCDSRSMVLNLTDSGFAVYEKVWTCFNEFTEKITDEIKPGQKNKLLSDIHSFLLKMNHNMNLK